MKFFLWLWLLAGPLFSKTICLNMIVKDEKNCILTALGSVKHLLDYWVIVDTGSSDGTQMAIVEFMKDIPGELHEKPWIDFSYNRNEALQIAKNKADYTLFIDADEEMVFDENFVLPFLDQDCYLMSVKEPSGAEYHRICLINNQLDWKWIGVVHESLVCDQAKRSVVLKNAFNISDTSRGNRSKDPQKYLKDAKLLLEELAKDPTNARNTFFLAQSYVGARKNSLALKYFLKRASMGGWDQEVFYAKYMVACLEEKTHKPAPIFIQSYLAAFEFRPSRIEPLFQLAKYYMREGEYFQAYNLLKKALEISPSEDAIFVETWIYDWGALYYFSECCAQLKKINELNQALEKLLFCKNLSLEKRRKVEEIMSKASFLSSSLSN